MNASVAHKLMQKIRRDHHDDFDYEETDLYECTLLLCHKICLRIFFPLCVNLSLFINIGNFPAEKM